MPSINMLTNYKQSLAMFSSFRNPPSTAPKTTPPASQSTCSCHPRYRKIFYTPRQAHLPYPCDSIDSSSNCMRRAVGGPHSSAELGMDVSELSVTAELIERTASKEAQPSETAGEAESLSKQLWVQQLISSHKDSKVVFTADGNSAEARQHLSTGLSQDHLFVSLLQNNMIQDMVVVYAAERKIITIMRLGVPVCGHPTIVHGGLISAIFDETFGVLLYAAGRWGHFDLTMVFTARLEVDYKKPLPAESTIVCEAEVESMEGRKIWLNARITDPAGEVVYASSRALFVKPKQPVSLPTTTAAAEATAANAAAPAAQQ